MEAFKDKYIYLKQSDSLLMANKSVFFVSEWFLVNFETCFVGEPPNKKKLQQTPPKDGHFFYLKTLVAC